MSINLGQSQLYHYYWTIDAWYWGIRNGPGSQTFYLVLLILQQWDIECRLDGLIDPQHQTDSGLQSSIEHWTRIVRQLALSFKIFRTMKLENIWKLREMRNQSQTINIYFYSNDDFSIYPASCIVILCLFLCLCETKEEQYCGRNLKKCSIWNKEFSF